MEKSIPPPDPRAVRLVEIQQQLLHLGYQYSDGNPDAWPMGLSLLAREQELILIGAWSPGPVPRLADTFNQFARQNPAGGMIFVGLDSADSPIVREFLDATIGTVAYVEALSGRFVLRRRKVALFTAPPRVLTEEGLPRVLAQPGPGVADIDARGELQRTLAQAEETQEFHQQTRLAGGARRPTATYAVIAICVAIFAGQYLLLKSHPMLVRELGRSMELHGPTVQQGAWWQVITSGFLHANEMHIFMNMLAMFYLGRLIEAFQGHWRLGAYFLFAVITGNLASLWWDPLTHSVGASGGIFGLMGALAAMIIRHRRDFPPAVWRSLKQGLVSMLLMNVVFFLVPFVNGSAHVGGLIGGFVLAMVISRSPTQPRGPAPWAIYMTAALLAATAWFGWYSVQTIPPEGREDLTRKRHFLSDIRGALHLRDNSEVGEPMNPDPKSQAPNPK